MVSHRQSHIQKRSVPFSHRRNVASLCRYNKVKKKVTWDKSIALREEELWELENELQETKEARPVVTFIRKYNPKVGKDDPYLLGDLGSRPGQVIVFNLEDGRVDVSEVLRHLGASQVDIEQEAGDWHTLEGQEYGKSKRQFQSGQVVLFRTIPKTHSTENLNALKRDKSTLKCRSTVSQRQVATIQPRWSLQNPLLKGRWSPWLDKWIVGGDTLEDYYGRVGRLIEDRRDRGGGLCGIGIVLRLAFHHKHTRLLLTCRHMVAQEGEPNISGARGNLFAFGGPVKVLHTSKKYDLALLQGPPLPGSKGFDLAPEGEEQPGREVRLVTFPWYLDNVWGQLPLKEVRPAEMPGRIAYMGASQKNPSKPLVVDAIATYMGGLPGCSGGAVTLNSKLLCGVHSGVYPLRSQAGMASAILVAEKNSPLQRKNYRSQTMIDASTKLVPSLPRLARKQNIQSLQLTGSRLFTKCPATHGYLAVYVSSTHIRETCLEWYAKPGIKKILDSLLPY